MDLLITAIFLAIIYFIGTKTIEKKHYSSIRKRELKFLELPSITAKNIAIEGQEIKEARMVCGSVVISIDHFKKFLGGLRNIFGGEIGSFETVLDRARREAILRMKEQSPEANIIVNMRIETSTIGRGQGKQQSMGCSEVLAYGTAITFQK